MVNCSTSGQYFHVLRRQAKWAIRRPLVVMTPKSLLRATAASCSLADLSAGRFETVLDDPATSSFTRPPAFVSGGGGLTGTVADYIRFCEMLRRGGELDGRRIIGPRTLDLMRMNHLPGGKDLAALDVDLLTLYGNIGVGFGLGFASTIDQVATGALARGDYYWGGAASTVFWVDPIEDLWVVFMTQLMPSVSFDFRGQLRSLVYSAIVD